MEDKVLSLPPILERFRLDGRVALVTGSGQGIGRAFAHALGEAGAAVAVVDLVSERASATTAELKRKGIDAIDIVADVSVPEQVRTMVEGIGHAELAAWVQVLFGEEVAVVAA